MPRTTAWLAGLPRGLDSYPECLVKGSLLRRLVKSQSLQPHLPLLPPELLGWFESPPLVSAWVPEVHLFAMLHALRDLVYEEHALHTFVSAGIERMISSPLYKIMFLVVTPKRLLQGIGRRWDQFHRGTTMTATDREDVIDVHVDHPAHLYSATIRGLTAATFLTAVTAAGGRGYRVQAMHDESTPTTAVFRTFRPR
jgi:hypothetical protein